jgi:uncharacterized Zn-binding protein involved in type VI secretion
MPKYAARVTDIHQIPRGGGPIQQGCATVLIGGQPAARVGDQAKCGNGVDTVAEGESTVLIGGKPAARMGDKHSCGGQIVSGCTTVIIGKDVRADCLTDAAKDGTVIVEASVQ